jgi:ABC-type antimicrobial peptide transport system permease subunit
MALLLVAIGLYGLLAQFVVERRREIGVRMALGARPAQVLSQVVRQSAVVTIAGLLLGLIVAFSFARVMGALVFDISPRDPVTFVLAPLILGGDQRRGHDFARSPRGTRRSARGVEIRVVHGRWSKVHGRSLRWSVAIGDQRSVIG